MVEVFITNIEEAQEAKRMTSLLGADFADLRINLDLDDSKPGAVYPCRHTVLRVEGDAIDAERILEAVHRLGYRCDILEDKICNSMTEIWDATFKEKQAMWGFEPARSAVVTKNFFLEKALKNILIPGIGYGRNAQIFIENGMTVTGIEISPTAIELGQKQYGTQMRVHLGSVTNMPFDTAVYNGIFCYGLIHLLGSDERAKLIRDCYNQLADGGYMVFAAISKEAHTYGQGRFISKDYYEVFEGIKMFFYDEESIREEFGEAGLFETVRINEQYPFYLIKCRKGNPGKQPVAPFRKE